MSGVELVWTRTHAVLTTAIASVAVSTWLFQSGGTIVASVREGVAREPARLVGALSSLADYVHGTYGISGSIVRGVLFSAVLVGAVWGYMHVSNLVQAQLQRKKVSIAQFLTHAKNFRHAHNGEMSTKYASFNALLIFATLDYCIEPANAITAAVVLLQGAASNWKKHWLNFALFTGMLLLTLVMETWAHLSKRAADAALNDVPYLAAVIASDGRTAAPRSGGRKSSGGGCGVSYQPLATPSSASTMKDTGVSGVLTGFSTVKAESIGLGAIVVVPAGHRTPIEGYVLPWPVAPPTATGTGAGTAAAGAAAGASAAPPAAAGTLPPPVEVSPFSYAVTGENTILPPTKSLTFDYNDLARMVCVPAGTSLEQCRRYLNAPQQPIGVEGEGEGEEGDGEEQEAATTTEAAGTLAQGSCMGACSAVATADAAGGLGMPVSSTTTLLGDRVASASGGPAPGTPAAALLLPPASTSAPAASSTTTTAFPAGFAGAEASPASSRDASASFPSAGRVATATPTKKGALVGRSASEGTIPVGALPVDEEAEQEEEEEGLVHPVLATDAATAAVAAGAAAGATIATPARPPTSSGHAATEPMHRSTHAKTDPDDHLLPLSRAGSQYPLARAPSTGVEMARAASTGDAPTGSSSVTQSARLRRYQRTLNAAAAAQVEVDEARGRLTRGATNLLATNAQGTPAGDVALVRSSGVTGEEVVAAAGASTGTGSGRTPHLVHSLHIPGGRVVVEAASPLPQPHFGTAPRDMTASVVLPCEVKPRSRMKQHSTDIGDLVSPAASARRAGSPAVSPPGSTAAGAASGGAAASSSDSASRARRNNFAAFSRKMASRIGRLAAAASDAASIVPPQDRVTPSGAATGRIAAAGTTAATTFATAPVTAAPTVTATAGAGGTTSSAPAAVATAGAAAAAPGGAGATGGWDYVLLMRNGDLVVIPPHLRRLNRGVIHAPDANAQAGGIQRPPLFLLATLPRRFETTGSGACVLQPSRWLHIVKRVMIVQVVLLFLFSVQGWASGTAMTEEMVTFSSFLAFVLGQIVMGNTLLPTREKLANAMFYGCVRGLFPEVSVKEQVALETVRTVRNVVSDKTGTLTTDAMQYQWPLRYDERRATATAASLSIAAAGSRMVDTVGPALLFATNDSTRNPLYERPSSAAPASTAHDGADARIDSRLRSTYALCTTSEEGAVFEALVQQPSDRPPVPNRFSSAAAGSGSEQLSAASLFPDEHRSFEPIFVDDAGKLPLAIYYDPSSRQLVRMLWHYKGGFVPALVARFSVVSLWTKQRVETLADARTTALGSPSLPRASQRPRATLQELAAEGWVLMTHERAAPATASVPDAPAVIVAQGGGDAVARMCGPAAVAWERRMAEVNPDRTLGHSYAPYPPMPELAKAAGEDGSTGITLPFTAEGAPQEIRHASWAVAHEQLTGVKASGSTAPAAAAPAAAGAASTAGSGAGAVPAAGASSSASSSASPAAPAPTPYYTMAYLSKFINPVVPGGDHLFGHLEQQGIRLHICTGDTYLTLQAVLREMKILPEAAPPAAGGAAANASSAAAASSRSGLESPSVVPADVLRKRTASRLAAKINGSAKVAGAHGPSTASASVKEIIWDHEDKSTGTNIVEIMRQELSAYLDETGNEAMAADPIGVLLGSRPAPLQRVLRLATVVDRVVVFCSSEVLKLLHAHYWHELVRSVVSNERVIFAFYRIKADLKPHALQLMSSTEPDCVHRFKELRDETTGAIIGYDEVEPKFTGTGADDTPALSIFIGDGPNDAPALSKTCHSVAISQGSLAAKHAAHFEVTTSTALPDLITISRLFHGGRAIIMRDIVFVGTFVVVVLSVALHMRGFAVPGKRIKFIEDPWNPLYMTAFSSLVHTPRMLVTALTEGLHNRWKHHQDLVFRVFAECVLALFCSLWVGTWLKDQLGKNLDMFASLSLASLAVISHMRQNLLVSSKLFSLPRLLPPIAAFRGDPAAIAHYVHASPDAQPAPMARVTRQFPVVAFVVWLLNGFPGQLALLTAYLWFVSKKQMVLTECVWMVTKACFGPAVLMIFLRCVLWLSRTSPAGLRM